MFVRPIVYDSCLNFFKGLLKEFLKEFFNLQTSEDKLRIVKETATAGLPKLTLTILSYCRISPKTLT